MIRSMFLYSYYNRSEIEKEKEALKKWETFRDFISGYAQRKNHAKNQINIRWVPIGNETNNPPVPCLWRIISPLLHIFFVHAAFQLPKYFIQGKVGVAEEDEQVIKQISGFISEFII